MRRKGFIFTLDATLGLFLMILALMAITLLALQSEDDPFVKIHSLRQAHDRLAVLDAQGMLDSANCTAIGKYMNQSLAKGENVGLQIDTFYKDVGGFAFLANQTCGQDPPQNISTYWTEYGFVRMKNGRAANYSVARMYTWQTG